MGVIGDALGVKCHASETLLVFEGLKIVFRPSIVISQLTSNLAAKNLTVINDTQQFSAF